MLLAIGLVMVYSASIAMAEASAHTGNRAWYFLARHSMFLLVGLLAAVVAVQIPMRAWRQLAPWLFIAGAVLLVLVLIPGIGKSVNGSRRWLSFAVFNVQPSEFMKLAVVIYAASYAVRRAAFLHAEQPLKQTLVRGFLPLFVVMVLTGGLLLLEPDFGAFVVIVAIAFGILYLGGLDWRLFLGLALLLPVALAGILVAAPYRLQRLTAFLDPWSDPLGKGYQLSHSLIAFGRGEWFGVGLGSSVEKLLFLPEAHTDFLLAVVAEELGFVGVVAVIALFMWLLFRTYAIGKQAARLEQPFAALVAQGIGVWIGVQAFINIGVNMGVLPTKGLTLPLLSFGGSGIVANCIARRDPAADRLREPAPAAGVHRMTRREPRAVVRERLPGAAARGRIRPSPRAKRDRHRDDHHRRHGRPHLPGHRRRRGTHAPRLARVLARHARRHGGEPRAAAWRRLRADRLRQRARQGAAAPAARSVRDPVRVPAGVARARAAQAERRARLRRLRVVSRRPHGRRAQHAARHPQPRREARARQSRAAPRRRSRAHRVSRRARRRPRPPRRMGGQPAARGHRRGGAAGGALRGAERSACRCSWWVAASARWR